MQKKSGIVFLKMMLHWLLAEIVALLAFLVQISYSIDADPSMAEYFLSGETYKANVPLFILGMLILFGGYFLVWKLWLYRDWIDLKNAAKGWKIAAIVLEYANFLIMFCMFFLVMVFTLNWGDFAKAYRFVDYSILFDIVVLTLMPLVFFKKKY